MNNCIFCEIVKGQAKSWKIYENESVYAFLDIQPANPYHTLVIPKNHYKNIYDIPEDDLKAVITVLKKITTLFQEKLGIHNVQIINSSGTEAQQDVFHFHFHILPRQSGDNQDIHWSTHPEWVDKFNLWVEKLK